jgi:Flp pilus assembly protein TadG
MKKKNSQAGATTIEFALVFMLFMTFLLAVVDFSRMLWTWNAANEATRWGARTAVLCNPGAAAVLANMQRFVPQLTASNLAIQWYDVDGASESCDHRNCTAVNVEIVNLNYDWISPIGFGTLSDAITMPRFSTYLPREVMGQDPDSSAVCS